MQNIATGDRPKDSVHKKAKTETQFKREFLKSEDAAQQKDNLDRLPRARGRAPHKQGRRACVCLCYCELLFRLLLWIIFSCFYHRQIQLEASGVLLVPTAMFEMLSLTTLLF